MLRTSLTDVQRAELQALRRTDLPAVPRDRLEMVLVSAAGWSPPKIAGYLGRHPHTVRAALKGFAARGPAAFYPDAPGPDPDHDRRAAVTGKLSELLGQERTRTARQLVDALGPDVGIAHRQTRRYLALVRAGYPDGLTGDRIPLLVRILSVADVYDALSSDRPYRPAMSHARCLEVMAADAARGRLDARLLRVFAEVVTEPLACGRSA